MKNEAGRTLMEMLVVLIVMGVLSVGGLILYSRMMQREKVDVILNALQQKIIEINSSQVNAQNKDIDQMNTFLEKFTTIVDGYKISFHAAPELDGSFVSEVTHKDGSRIKGAFCRDLITKMAEQKFVSDVDFTLKDEIQEDGSMQDITVPLNGKMINLEDVCGG